MDWSFSGPVTLCQKLLTIPVSHHGLNVWGGGILAFMMRAGFAGFKGHEHLEQSQCCAT